MGACFFKSKFENVKKLENTFFDLEAVDIDGNLVKMSQYSNKKAIIIVNVAWLVDLYKKYKDSGLEILGFPCNQFMSQEPWAEPKIKDFIIQKFGASFPLFQKIEVNGDNPHPVYKFLRTNSELYDPQTNKAKQIPWNFSKFVVDRSGKVTGFFKPTVKPEELEQTIQKLLAN
ncbi:hypothetical protein ABPG74_021878 [Tetrahymena malaccensis]